MANKSLTTSAGNVRECPAGQLMLGSALAMETIPAGVSEVIPAGYQLVVHGTFEIAGTLDIAGKLVLL